MYARIMDRQTVIKLNPGQNVIDSYINLATCETYLRMRVITIMDTTISIIDSIETIFSPCCLISLVYGKHSVVQYLNII
jgi:hypothetical protein